MKIFDMNRKKSIIAGYLLWTVGIALGTAILVLGSSMLASGKASVDKAFSNAKLYYMEGPQNISWQEAQEITKTFPGVKEQIPIYKTSGTAEVSRKAITVTVIGTTDRYLGYKQSKLIKGSFLSDYSIENAQNVTVISSDVSLRLFGTKDGVGRDMELRINGSSIKLNVAGIITDKTDQTNYCYIPASLFEDIAPNAGLTGMVLSSRANMHPREAEALAVRLMEVNGVSGWTSKYYPYSDYLKAVYDRYLYSGIVLSGLFLLLGGIGSAGNISYFINNNASRIKLARFYGLTDDTLGNEIICLGLYGGILQGFLGLLLGLACSYAYSRYFNLTFATNPYILIIGFSIAVLVGILSGIYPAYKALQENTSITI